MMTSSPRVLLHASIYRCISYAAINMALHYILTHPLRDAETWSIIVVSMVMGSCHISCHDWAHLYTQSDWPAEDASVQPPHFLIMFAGRCLVHRTA